MKIRTLFLTLAFILAAIPALVAKIVTKEQARAVAQNFFTESISNRQVNWNTDNLVVSEISTFETEGQPAIYAFSNNGQGFILVSADDAMTPILGYSFESNLSASDLNPNFEYLLSDYLAQVKYVRSNSMSASTDIQNSWHIYLNGQSNKSVLADTTTVGPLITTMWNQGFPYNEFCPTEPNGTHLVPTGCVATAMSMIMNYYKYPLTGNGTHSYYAPGYGTQTVNYGATTYEWNAMQNTMNSSSGNGIPAIATLMYHAGVSVNMHYAADGSGAMSDDVPYALKTYFKYASAAQYVEKNSTSTTVWENMLMEQLDLNRPIYYSGKEAGANAGHAWVCDGYQIIGSTKMFHHNFGWGGAENGYFISTNPNGFNSRHAIVRNIYPNPAYYPYGCSAKTVEVPKGSIEDGSGPIDSYGNNLSCTWLIAPLDTDTVSSITATFIRFDLSSSDSLYFYDGEDASAPLLAAYSGSTLPADVSSTGDRMFIQFITDASEQSGGWLFEFSSTLPNLCSGTKTMLEPSGSFTDGSGPYTYKNNSLCKFKIQPPYAMNLTLVFDEFELMPGDEMKVHSLATSDLIATLTGSDIPEPITVPFDGLYLIFTSNSYYSGSGFSASYWVGNVGSDEVPGVNSLNISPNPASDFIMVRASNSKTQQMQLLLNDMTGKNLFNETFSAQKGNIEKSIDVSNFNAGMYFLTVKTAEGITTQKVIVK